MRDDRTAFRRYRACHAQRPVQRPRTRWERVQLHVLRPLQTRRRRRRDAGHFRLRRLHRLDGRHPTYRARGRRLAAPGVTDGLHRYPSGPPGHRDGQRLTVAVADPLRDDAHPGYPPLLQARASSGSGSSTERSLPRNRGVRAREAGGQNRPASPLDARRMRLTHHVPDGALLDEASSPLRNVTARVMLGRSGCRCWSRPEGWSPTSSSGSTYGDVQGPVRLSQPRVATTRTPRGRAASWQGGACSTGPRRSHAWQQGAGPSSPRPRPAGRRAGCYRRRSSPAHPRRK
jgi:hypothetical protein